MYPIEPNLSVAFAITLKQEREKQGLTQKEVAKRFRTNPILATIEKLQNVFGTMFFSF
ncbi:hypothetical protein AGMMS49940_00270 [Spirochaetia bacterium]|nr:hypothetical protein AGMMS49940_00270 [Spirochaetia bacterium]